MVNRKLKCDVFIGLLLMALSPSYSKAVNCPPVTGQYRDLFNLKHDVALIGNDDRVERTSQNTPAHIENAQARCYCVDTAMFNNPAKPPTRDQLIQANAGKGNATIAFEDDVAIVPRHFFLKKDGLPDYKPTNCFIEHVKTGEIIQVVRAAWPALQKEKGRMAYFDRDLPLYDLGRNFRRAHGWAEKTFTLIANGI